MTKQTNATNTNKPTHHLYRVEGDGEAATWTKVGAAWANRDGKGLTIVAPVLGRLVLRENTPRPAQEAVQA